MPDKPDSTTRSNGGVTPDKVDDLESRRQSLGKALDARTAGRGEGSKGAQLGGKSGFGNALKLSSEFIGAVIVGAGIGYVLDRFAGTAPWGMIVFLLLGFLAGILNVLRSAGVVAEPGQTRQPGSEPGEKQE